MPRIGVGKTTAALLAGEIDVAEWSDEELIRGQRKGKNGKWQGRKPTVVPRVVHDELVRRRLGQAGELLRDSLLDAVRVLVSVANDEEAQNSDRLKAAQLIIERVMGKTPETIKLEVEPLWSQALRSAMVNVGGVVNGAGAVIDVPSTQR